MGNAVNNTLLLRDIHLPGSPGFWPLAPGWWVLLFLLLIMGAWLTVKLLRRARQKKYRQSVFEQYEKLEKNLLEHLDAESLAEINIFLRQVAMTRYPRANIASLTGQQWLKFLDESGDTHEFSEGVGQVLADGPYRKGRVLRLNMTELQPLLKRWINKVLSTEKDKPNKKYVKTGGVGT